MTRALLFCLALAACEELPTPPAAGGETAAPAAPPPFVPREPEVPDPSDPCGAGSYLGLIGRQASTIARPQDETFRILPAGAETGEGVQPARLNVRVNPAGLVERVHCG